MKRNILFSVCAVFILALSACSSRDHKEEVQSFKLRAVKIHEGPFLQAQQADLHYLLALDKDRLLAPFLKDAGLKPFKENYPNWENTGLDGHIGGHYLSALSFMYAATGDQELLDRIEYMLTWLARCQEKNGNGYVGGVPNGQQIWKEVSEGKIDAGTFSLNTGWVPLYNIHKLFAGLYDVYTQTGIEEAKTILIKLTDWFYTTIMPLTDEQLQTILISEHGGMNDVFVDVYEITGDEKYLEMARRFSHHAILDPLLEKKNELTGLHANTQIPKIVGFAKYATAAHDKDWMDASKFFWETVVNKWTISIGGNSVREHFHPYDDFSTMIESEEGPETCNTYNMLKLSRLLYADEQDPKYLDYYERALFNHILSSEHPEKGGFVYFTPMRPRHYRVYSQVHTSFWCCVGSGLENPGKYGEFIYTHTQNDLNVNLFIASEVNWQEKGVKLTQETKFPNESATSFVLHMESPTNMGLNVRLPNWVDMDSYSLQLNGNTITADKIQNGFLKINRKWNDGDRLSFAFEMKTIVEYLPDSSHYVSFKKGPIVLGAVTDTTDIVGLWADDSRMGHIAKGKKYPLNEAPSIVMDSIHNLSELLVPVEGKPMHFTLKDLKNKQGKNIELEPFYQIHETRYMVYWPLYSSEEFSRKKEEILLKEQQEKELAAKTIDLVWPGEQQPEADHFVKFKDSEAGVYLNRHWRHARGFFSYEMKHPGQQSCALRITYFGGDRDRTFRIFVNNEVVAKVALDGTLGADFVEVDYAVPTAYYKNKKTFTVKFEPVDGSVAGGIYGVRLIKN